MDCKLFSQLVVTIVVAILGGWMGHFFSARRDVTNERRKLRISYLLEAYRRLEGASNRDDPKKCWAQLESAIGDIQLLGSARQVLLARQFAVDMAKNRAAPLDELIYYLRESLWSELVLEPIFENVIYLRFVSSDMDVQNN